MSRRIRQLAAALVGAAVLCVASSAAAQQPLGEAFVVGYEPSWYALGGVTGGASFQSPQNGGFAGVELSVVRLLENFWAGAYADAAFDFGPQTAIVTAGPEIGYSFAGIDGGAAARFGESGTDFGLQGRLVLTAGVAAIYGRYLYWPDSAEQGVQVGAMFKFPIVEPW